MVTKGQRRQIYEKVLLRLVQLTTADSPRSRAVLPTEISVFFTGLVGAHRGRCQALIVDAIRGATQRIRMMSYCFASKEIAEALVVAARRIPVELVADRTSVPRQLEDTGVRIHVDRLHHRAHNKVLIVDDCMVFTGSFNFTSTADHQNAENLVRIKNRTVIGQYVSYWQRTIAELEKSSATGYPPARRGVESRRNAVAIGRLKGAPHV